MLGESEYIAGDTYTVADITAFVTVEFAGWLKLGLADDQTNAKRWYEAVKARPSSAL
jgi:glutathione S-transferase